MKKILLKFPKIYNFIRKIYNKIRYHYKRMKFHFNPKRTIEKSIKKDYEKNTNKELDLISPKTFNEKIKLVKN